MATKICPDFSETFNIPGKQLLFYNKLHKTRQHEKCICNPLHINAFTVV